jgi:hypothetical protein
LATTSKVKVHGLVRCTSDSCRNSLGGLDRYFNRDVAAVLNFRNIWNGHANGTGRPNYLKRQNENEPEDAGDGGENDEGAVPINQPPDKRRRRIRISHKPERNELSQ